MLLKLLKILAYHLPLKETRAFHGLRAFIYQQGMKRFMQRNYGKIITKEIDGITYELDLSEAIEASLYYSGVYEFETLKCLQQCIRPDMIVFEIGANIGAHSFEIAKLLHTGAGKVYCFEPTDYAFNKLLHNHSLNNFRNMFFEKIALSDQAGSQILTPTGSLDTMAFTASWDIKNGRSKNATEQHIFFQTLDGYVQEHKITRIDLLKIDVDGYELKIIKGGTQTISRYTPVIIIELSECMLHYIGDTLEELLAALQYLGYTFQPVHTRRVLDIPQLIREVRERQSLDCLCRYHS
ncbi:methyltransferase FkbM family [Candidatus Vecturithrix granuli]|uniref:Methyltransferase FkbM family n=1 Tax=Vecturithrix granuli TaxID=1499967 RepID=A0A081BTR8_VECG1|nr:methyltransferase FkbM family [Candidatus Vecturithrix granuli]